MTALRRIAWLPTPAGIFGLILFAALVSTQGARLLIDGDTYTHIRCGEWMLNHGALLKIDIFSHTVPGAPWIAHEWGSQLLMAWLYGIGGLPAVAIFFAATTALSMTIMYRLLERLEMPPYPALGMMLLAMLLFFPTMLARPHVFTWLFGAITLDLLHRNGRVRLLLPLLTVIWANLHGGFLLGLALQTAYLVGKTLDHLAVGPWREAVRASRADAMVTLASAIAGLCTPFGFESFLFYATVSSDSISRFNPEWQSPNFQDFWPFRCYVIGLLLALFATRQRPTWTNLILLGLFLDAALAHRRHISLAAMGLLPLWVELVQSRSLSAFQSTASSDSKDLPCSPWSGPALLVAIATALLVTLPQLPGDWRSAMDQRFPASARFPWGTMAWLEQHPQQGRVFNEYGWGAALIYRTNGKVPVFIDGFADKYGEAVYRDYYLIADLEKEADELLNKYRIDWVLFPSDAPLVRYLLQTNNWDEVYRDAQASVLTRRIPDGT